jgi:hypothetical protein
LRFFGLRGANLGQASDFHLTDSLSGEVQDSSDLLQCGSSSLGDIEDTRLGHFPDFEVRKVELDGPASRIDVEIEVMFTTHKRARSWHVLTVGPNPRPLDIFRVFKRLRKSLFFSCQPFGGDGLGPKSTVACWPDPQTDLCDFGLRELVGWKIVVRLNEGYGKLTVAFIAEIRSSLWAIGGGGSFVDAVVGLGKAATVTQMEGNRRIHRSCGWSDDSQRYQPMTCPAELSTA